MIRDLLGSRLALIGATAAFVAGSAAVLTWEHRSPWGLEAKRAALEERIDAPVVGLEARVAAWRTSSEEWKAAEARCASQRREDQSEASRAVERASANRAAATSASFNQGYAAGRTAGLQRCGATNATPDPDGGLADVPGPGGLRNDETDLAAIFGGGAYRPGGALQPRP